MKYIFINLLFVISYSVFSQESTTITVDSLNKFQYYDKSQKKVKKEFFYDKNKKLHPYVILYNRSGLVKCIYYYNHGILMKSNTFTTKGDYAGEKVIKINGIKVDKTVSTQSYLVDSSGFHSKSCNYTDSAGNRQGKWYIHDIINVDNSYKEFYYTWIYIDGKKYGKWRYYYYYGRQLYAIINYKNDVVNGEVIFFNRKGNKTAKYIYKDNKMNGEYESYYENGNIRTKAFYKNGILEGEYIRYKKNGKVKKDIKDVTKESPYSW